MKNEHAAFATRLRAALKDARIDASPVALEKLLARQGVSVTAQAVSGWLGGKHMPKPDAMRALAYVVGMEPWALQFGGKPMKGVREVRATWPEHVRGHDRLAFEAFLKLPEKHRELVRELIAALEVAASTVERSTGPM